MATPIPAKLKPADISRFALRATQLEKAKPVVAYWCNYWILKQIIEKGLQNADTECLHYTTQLMDKIERAKADNSDNDAILDDVAAKAYVEQFGLDTFQRADNAVRANKASRQTADTFLAASIFLELCQVWGELDPEIAAKIKFAKYHSLRITKALKAGEDPNLSNPVQEPDEQETVPALDPNDPEVMALNGSAPESASTKRTRQPSVVEVPDEHDQIQRNLARKSLLDESLHPSRSSSVPRPPESQQRSAPPPPPVDAADDESFYQPAPATKQDEASPSAPVMDRTSSAGGGYFPQVPDAVAPSPPLDLPSAPSDYAAYPHPPDIPDVASLPPPGPEFTASSQAPTSPDDLIQPPAPPSGHQPQPPYLPRNPDPRTQPGAPGSYPPPPHSYHATPGPGRALPHPATTYRAPPQTYPQPVPLPPVAPPTSVVVDEEAVAKAQKHARWAISALNFEDVNTAIRELRGALQSLGAQ